MFDVLKSIVWGLLRRFFAWSPVEADVVAGSHRCPNAVGPAMPRFGSDTWQGQGGGLSPLWLIIAGLDGAVLVVLGAAGAHGVTSGGDAEGLFDTATQYQAWHALAIAMIGFAGGRAEPAAGRTVHAAGALFLAGTVLFCGSLYIRAFGGAGLFPMAAPIGGTLLILGWLAVAAIGGLEQFRVVRNRRRRSGNPKNLL